MSLVLFTLAWLIGIWIASRIAMPNLVLGIAASALTQLVEADVGSDPVQSGDQCPDVTQRVAVAVGAQKRFCSQQPMNSDECRGPF